MAIQYEPRAGAWYVNKTGKLMKVRMLLYSSKQLRKVLIEFLDGMRITVDVDAWNYLDLDIIWQDAYPSAVAATT